MIQEILDAKRIFIIGAGRSGLVARAFAMRLMHLGFQSYVVGETVTPPMKRGDMIVVFSGSGETKTVADIAEIAKSVGGRVCLITTRAASRIGRVSDCIVRIEGHSPKIDEAGEFEMRQMLGDHKSFAPLGTLFETAAMIFADAVISRLMEITKTDVSTLKDRHANIE
jgi:6-phospho-3-hexuloisomerase